MIVERPQETREPASVGPQLPEEPKKKESGWKISMPKGEDTPPLKNSGRTFSWLPNWAVDALEFIRGPKEKTAKDFVQLKGLVTTKEATVLKKEDQFRILEFLRINLEKGGLEQGIESFSSEQRALALGLLKAYEGGEPFSLSQGQLQNLLTGPFNFHLKNQQKEMGHALYGLVQKLFREGLIEESTAKSLMEAYETKKTSPSVEILTTLQTLDQIASDYIQVEAFGREGAALFKIADLGLHPGVPFQQEIRFEGAEQIPQALSLEENEKNGPYIQRVGEKLKDILLKTFEVTLTLTDVAGNEVIFSKDTIQKLPPKEVIQLLKTYTRPNGRAVLETPLPVIIRCWAETQIETIDHLDFYPTHVVGKISQLFIPGVLEKELDKAIGEVRGKMDLLRLQPTKHPAQVAGLQEMPSSLMSSILNGKEETMSLAVKPTYSFSEIRKALESHS
jgi:hypothetical protein